MKVTLLSILILMLFPFTLLMAQESAEYVDVKQTNELIARLERANENHRTTITSNNERKSFLENRVQTSESRIAKIGENLDYARETNLELNELNRETKDQDTKDRLESSRSELMSVIWLLSTEYDSLTEQTVNDKDEIDFLTSDTARREGIIQNNETDISALREAVSSTESKISEISSKLEDIIGRLDGLREEMDTE